MYVYPNYNCCSGNNDNYGSSWIWAIIVVVIIIFFLFPGYRGINNN